jgi:hypothetical protein
MSVTTACLLIAALAAMSLAYITPKAWLVYRQKTGIFSTGREAMEFCGKMNVAVHVHSDEKPMRNWIAAKSSGNAKATSVKWMCR